VTKAHKCKGDLHELCTKGFKWIILNGHGLLRDSLIREVAEVWYQDSNLLLKDAW